MARTFKTKAEPPSFLRLALKADLDQGTAYTICRVIDAVGSEIKGDDWDWDWLEGTHDYRSMIDQSILEPAWRMLAKKEWLSLQTSSEGEPRIATVAPLEGMTNLRTLVHQDNHVADLRPLSKMSRLKYLTIYRNKV